MNESLLVRNIWLEYIFLGLPLTLVFLKMILQPIFSKWWSYYEDTCYNFKCSLERKYLCFNFPSFYNYDSWTKQDKDGRTLRDEKTHEIIKLTAEEREKKYPSLEKDFQEYKVFFDKKSTKFAFVIKKISKFLNSFSCNDCGGYLFYCCICWILGFVFFVAMCCSQSAFNSEKELYDNGKYTTISTFDTTYESFPDWSKNAKVYIQKAEKLNETYFNEDGSVKKSAIGYIIPDENGNYPILDNDGNPTGKYLETINTNKMYKSFLKLCQNEEEVLK